MRSRCRKRPDAWWGGNHFRGILAVLPFSGKRQSSQTTHHRALQFPEGVGGGVIFSFIHRPLAAFTQTSR